MPARPATGSGRDEEDHVDEVSHLMQRLIRAWEVLEQTGVSLAEWHRKPEKIFFIFV